MFTRIKRFFTSFAFAGLVAVGQPAHAGIPVIDVANLQQSIQQVIAWSDQYRQMYTQIMQARALFENMTGSRALGLVFDNLDVEGAVPPEMMELVTAVQDARSELDRWSNFVENGIQHSANRQVQLRSLMNAINTTTDAKSIAELQGRIQAEVAAVGIETNRILLAQEHLRTEEKKTEQLVAQLRAADDMLPSRVSR